MLGEVGAGPQVAGVIKMGPNSKQDSCNGLKSMALNDDDRSPFFTYNQKYYPFTLASTNFVQIHWAILLRKPLAAE